MPVKFNKANVKLQKLAKKIGKVIYSFDLPAGKSCPFALECRSMAVETINGLRIKDGPKCKFRCYAASCEVRLTNVYLAHRKNYRAIKAAKTKSKIAKLLLDALPRNAQVIRLHSSGDFFTKNYFEAVVMVARLTPHIRWYGYTKAIKYLVGRELPPNLKLTASYGGTQDHLIDAHGIKACLVVRSLAEAKSKKLKVDVNDYLCYNRSKKSFAVLIHGPQPKRHPILAKVK